MQVYGLKRLVRGLASGRQGARQGYALALSKLLADVPALPISEVLAVMASELEVSGQAKASNMYCSVSSRHTFDGEVIQEFFSTQESRTLMVFAPWSFQIKRVLELHTYHALYSFFTCQALSVTHVSPELAFPHGGLHPLQGSEAHDQLLGQVFGYAAIIRSSRQLDEDTAVKCAEGLVYIANKKSFLRELAANVLLELTGTLGVCLNRCSC